MGYLFHRIASDYSCAVWDGLCGHLGDVPREDALNFKLIFNLRGSAAASEFREWVRFGIDVHIHNRKYQVKPHSSPWFLASFAAAIVHRNHFFYFYPKRKYFDSKVKFRQTSNCCKRTLVTFGEFPIVFWTKVNLLYLLYSAVWRCCLLYLIKQNC